MASIASVVRLDPHRTAVSLFLLVLSYLAFTNEFSDAALFFAVVGGVILLSMFRSPF